MQDAKEGDVVFFSNGQYKEFLLTTKASVCFISQENLELLNKECIAFISQNPSLSFSLFVDYLYGTDEEYSLQEFSVNINNYHKNSFGAFIHNTCIIEDNVVIEKDCVIHQFTTIRSNTKIKSNTIIMPNCFIGKNVEIAENCYVYSNCSIMNARIHENCLIKSNVSIGDDGFGFAVDEKNMSVKKNQHSGFVIIHKNVTIGSNSTIHRGYISDTIIGESTKIDSLVMIAHGVHIGRGCFICGQTAIAGSAALGDFITCGGQVGIPGHVKIASKTTFAAKTGVIGNIEQSGVYAGYPAINIWTWRRINAMLRKMVERKSNSAG